MILYAESLDRSAWFLIALRDGKIEIQFKNEFTTKITTGGKVINDGQWNMVGFCRFHQEDPYFDTVCLTSLIIYFYTDNKSKWSWIYLMLYEAYSIHCKSLKQPLRNDNLT